MLRNPDAWLGAMDPIARFFEYGDGAFGSNTDPVKPVQIEDGAVIIKSHNVDILIWGGNAPTMEQGYPDIVGIEPYGVCDTPEQFLARYGPALRADERTFVVAFTHVAKDPENKGIGGGWRWHKWGPYVGTGQPTMEYLDDEDGFADGVYCYKVVQIAGPIVKRPWEAS